MLPSLRASSWSHLPLTDNGMTSARRSQVPPAASAGVVQPVPITWRLTSVPPVAASKYFHLPGAVTYRAGDLHAIRDAAVVLARRMYTAFTLGETVALLVWPDPVVL